MVSQDALALFSLARTAEYAQRFAACIETPPLPVEERPCEAGEHKVRPLVGRPIAFEQVQYSRAPALSG
jgi:hypothetical protein